MLDFIVIKIFKANFFFYPSSPLLLDLLNTTLQPSSSNKYYFHFFGDKRYCFNLKLNNSEKTNLEFNREAQCRSFKSWQRRAFAFFFFLFKNEISNCLEM